MATPQTQTVEAEVISIEAQRAAAQRRHPANRERTQAIEKQARNAGTDEAHHLVNRLRREALNIAAEHLAPEADVTFATRVMVDALFDELRNLREKL